MKMNEQVVNELTKIIRKHLVLLGSAPWCYLYYCCCFKMFTHILPTFSLASEARTISVHSPASFSIHHSPPPLLAPSPQQHESFSHILYKQTKIKPLSTLKFLRLPHSLAFPHRQTTGKHHLKALFLSFLFSHLFLTPLALTSLNSLHQRVTSQPSHAISRWKKDC